MEIEYFNNKLEKVLDLVNDNALNYVAEIVLYPAVIIGSNSTDEIIKAVLGSEIIVGKMYSSSAQDVKEELKSVLCYSGDYGAHPNKGYVGSEKQKTHLADLENKLKPLLSRASKVTGFSLKEGHPFYPVFWDFAFNIEVDGEAYVLIGSSSD